MSISTFLTLSSAVINIVHIVAQWHNIIKRSFVRLLVAEILCDNLNSLVHMCCVLYDYCVTTLSKLFTALCICVVYCIIIQYTIQMHNAVKVVTQQFCNRESNKRPLHCKSDVVPLHDYMNNPKTNLHSAEHHDIIQYNLVTGRIMASCGLRSITTGLCSPLAQDMKWR